jgi:RNA polymerase sigma-70 factor, ECF subfamily
MSAKPHLLNASGPPDLENVVREEYPHVYRFAVSLGGDSADAQDATQQAFLALVKSADDIRDWGSVRSWLFTSAKRALNRTRTKNARYQPMPEDAPEPAVEPSSNLGDGARAVAALHQLEPEQREVLSLFYLQQNSYREIAAQTETPIGTVMSRLHRGKQRLRILLGIPELISPHE